MASHVHFGHRTGLHVVEGVCHAEKVPFGGSERPPLPKYIVLAIASGNFGVSVQVNVLVNLIVRLPANQLSF